MFKSRQNSSDQSTQGKHELGRKMLASPSPAFALDLLAPSKCSLLFKQIHFFGVFFANAEQLMSRVFHTEVGLFYITRSFLALSPSC